MIIQQDNSTKPGTYRIDVPINSIRRWGGGHFAFELKQLLQAYRARHGYYPAPPDLDALLTREFGQVLADQARRDLPYLMAIMRRWGIYYHAEAARQYHAAPVAACPVLDLNAAYAAPFGTVQNYLFWKLPRLCPGDSFEVNGVTIERNDDDWRFEFVFRVKVGRRRYKVAAAKFARAMAVVLVFLRSASPVPVVPAVPGQPPLAVNPTMPVLPPIVGIADLRPTPYRWQRQVAASGGQ
jgi:hypothetical protein